MNLPNKLHSLSAMVLIQHSMIFFLINDTNSKFKYIQNVSDNFSFVKKVLFRVQDIYKRKADKK